jgi:hypothetical protein
LTWLLRLADSLYHLCASWLGDTRCTHTTKELRHEVLVRDQFEPGECESWVLLGVQLDEQITKRENHLEVCLLVEELSIIDQSQDVYQDTVVRLLVKITLFVAVILIDN